MSGEEKNTEHGTMEQFTEEDPLKASNEKPKKSFCQHVCSTCSKITVEPSVMMFVLSCILTIMTSTNLYLEKACRVNLNYTTEVCDAITRREVSDELKEYEVTIQKLTASLTAWKSVITSTLPPFFALMIGSWSDRTGRKKVFLLIPIFGQVLINISNMLNRYFFYQLSLEVLVFSEAIIEGFTGSWCICFMTVFSYISSITNDRNRTFRMGIVNFCLTVGFPIGTGLSGILLKKLGYYFCYGMAGGIQLANFMYTFCLLKDPKRTKEQKEDDGKGILHFFRTLFDFSNLKDTLKLIVSNSTRIGFLLFLVTILFGTMYGEMSVIYLLTRYRYNWDEMDYSQFQAYNFVLHTIGTLFSITVFSKWLQWHDSVLGFVSTTSKIASAFVYCFAPTGPMFYFGPLVEILNGTSLLAARSIISKLVHPQEFGKVNSIFALSESVMPLIYVPLYTKVYTSTMQVFPSAFFLLSAALLCFATVVFVWLFVEHRINLKKERKDAIQQDT